MTTRNRVRSTLFMRTPQERFKAQQNKVARLHRELGEAEALAAALRADYNTALDELSQVGRELAALEAPRSPMAMLEVAPRTT